MQQPIEKFLVHRPYYPHQGVIAKFPKQPLFGFENGDMGDYIVKALVAGGGGAVVGALAGDMGTGALGGIGGVLALCLYKKYVAAPDANGMSGCGCL